MIDYKVKAPVAIVVFNRPDCTQKVFEQVRSVKPSKLYIIGDGPRKLNRDDEINCTKTKEIFNNIDWECEVFSNFSDKNLGCGKRPATGISWVFENEESAIILEDDCVPDLSFFHYCDDLLERYKEDERIMLISGTNIFGYYDCEGYDYIFSYFGGIHGWASWSRAWKYFDYDMPLWHNKIVKNNIKYFFMDRMCFYQRSIIYDELSDENRYKTVWDYQWGFARLTQSGMAIVPKHNLIANVGFGENATHTKNSNSRFANLKTTQLNMPLKHPPYLMVDREYDRKYFNALNKNKLLLFLRYWKKKLFDRFN